jgi:leader peptidase (prepilin peptidase) / N-methyltransferase
VGGDRVSGVSLLAASLRPSGALSARARRGPLQRWVVTIPVVAALAVWAFASFALDRALIFAFVAGVLAVLSAVDIQRGLIPNRIVLPAAAVTLAMQLVLFPDRALECVLAALAASLAFLITHLAQRSWIGMGDVKLALLMGAALGWGVVGAVLLGFVCVFPAALVVLVRGGLGARKATIPFGPFLSLGTLLVMFGPHLAGLGSG